MNMENNNYNQNFNNQPNNKPTQPVKNKFFNLDVSNSTMDVGAITSGETNNVINWGVGKKDSTSFSNQTNQSNQINSIETLDGFGVNQVNGDIFNRGSIETLDDFSSQTNSFNNSNPFNNQNNLHQFNGPVTPLFTESQNTVTQTSNNDTNQQFLQSMQSQQKISNDQAAKNSGWQNGLGTTISQGTDWMNSQPLSAASLGGASMNVENQPKDVVEQSRFFNANINNEIQNKQANVAQFTTHYGNGVGVMLDDPPPVFDELSALKSFVGNDFTKLSMSIFSFSTFIFGSLIFLHRKMYILGILFTLIETGISSFVPIKYSIVTILVIHVILALMVNPMYIKSSKRKVKVILNDKNNMKKNQVEIDNICHKRGKNNLLVAIMIYILCGGLMFAFSSTTISESIKNGLNFISNKVGKTDTKEPEEKSFNVEDYISISIPEEFSKEDKSYYSYVYITGDSRENSSCEVLIDRIKNVSNVEEYVENLRDRYNIVESVGMNTINEITWYTIVNKNDSGKIYYRAAKLQDISLMLEYKIGPKANSNVCEMNYSTIVSSIKEKEEN